MIRLETFSPWIRLCLCLFLFVVAIPPNASAIDYEVLQQTTVDTEALSFADGAQTKFGNIVNGVTHQQFPLQTYRGYQYAIYYDDERQVSLGRRKLPMGIWEVIRFTDYNITNQDTHNTAVLGICENDGTIHLSWDHHRSNLHYRRSVVGVANDPEAFTWSPALFGAVTNVLGPLGAITQVTYPRFIPMPNGNLMLYYRYFTSGNGDSVVRVYDGTTSQWLTSHGKFIARDIGSYSFGGATSDFRYAYINGIGYAGDRLHCTWIWRDRFTATNVNNQHDLCYAYSDDDGLTWKNSAGTQIAVTGSSSIHLDSPGLIVFPVDPHRGVANQSTQFAYPDGSIHVILPRYREGTTSTRYYHHHWRDSAGIWHFENTGRVSGARPELVGDDEKNLYLIYTAGNNLRILKGIPDAAFTAWSWSLIYNESTPPTGGDGQIDLSRWESERVLSIYHQEEPATILDYGSGTPIDGLPTPLYVTDFQVSLQAAQPNPAHEAISVAPQTSLSWAAGLEAVTHHVYFGTDPEILALATPASPEYQGTQSATHFTLPGPLQDGATYYWRIDEIEVDAGVRSGKIWSFTTQANLPPTIATATVQQVEANGVSTAIPVTLGDDQTPASNLILSAISSNTALLPNGSIILGGVGADRTVTITPTTGMSGFSTLTLTADDGSMMGTAQILISVGTPPADITQVTLTPFQSWTSTAAWSDSLAAHTGAHYLVPRNGQLKSPDGTSTFPGDSLTIEAGASLQIRSKASTTTLTTIDKLILKGGSTFNAGDYAELIAGTGNDETNLLDGNIAVSGTVRLRGYAGNNGNNPRDFRLLSQISGSGIIQSHASGLTSLHTCFIDHPANTFDGLWESSRGRFEFASAGAIGAASISILQHGELTIHGDWNNPSATLNVADSTDVKVYLNNHNWTVGTLTIGNVQVSGGSYTAAQLNALSDATFSGAGTITVLSKLETWRFKHFRTVANSGSAADVFDADADGEDNLYEFGTAQSPSAFTTANTSVIESGGVIEFHYTRSKEAVFDGMTFVVEWSDTLANGSWSAVGVTQRPDPENPGNETIENIIASVPAGSEDQRFVKLTIHP